MPAPVVTVTGAAGGGGEAGAGAGAPEAGTSAALAFFSKTCSPGFASAKPRSVHGPIVPVSAATHCGQSVFALTSLFQTQG